MPILPARFNQIGRHRPRLLLASLVACVAYPALPADWPLISRALVAWNAGVWLYLVSMAWLMFRALPARVRAIAEQEDASTVTTVALLSVGSVLSLLAIALELAQPQFGPALPRYLITVLTITGSWFLVGTIYTYHYAHLFYQSSPQARALRFPEDPAEPSYLDFLYFSFTIAVAAQTSDVAVASASARAAVLAQSVLSFVFNAAILGLTINIAAGLLASAH